MVRVRGNPTLTLEAIVGSAPIISRPTFSYWSGWQFAGGNIHTDTSKMIFQGYFSIAGSCCVLVILLALKVVQKVMKLI